MIVVSARDSSVATSNLLAEIAEAVKQNNYGSVTVEKKPIPDTKGDFIVQIAIDIGKEVAVGLVSEYIISMINRAIEAAKMRGDAQPNISVSDDVQ